MQNLENLVRRHLSTLLLLSLAGGFVVLLAELLITDHTDGIQNVAVIAAAVGAVAVLAGLFVKGTIRHVVVLLLLVLTLTGLVGTWQHFESSRDDEASRVIPLAAVEPSGYQAIAARGDAVQLAPQQESEENETRTDEREDKRGDKSAPPPLAPLSLSGLTLMGALVLLAKRDELQSS
ncbi:MAG: hypothetical protein IAE81_07365 [Caldilineaceae bacterium]|jgi:hypothetical protein|nr:hypothetical protein [Caldilineaceae bacterium]